MKPTAEYVRMLLAYDPSTGEFIWRERRGGKAIAGTIAGRAKPESGHIEIAIDRVRHGAHRLAFLVMTGSWPAGEIDHIDGNPANNRWKNLREATDAQNARNSRIRSTNKCGLKGVNWHKARACWVAQITVDRKKVHLGLFDTAEEAHSAYVAAARKHHGQFARAA